MVDGVDVKSATTPSDDYRMSAIAGSDVPRISWFSRLRARGTSVWHYLVALALLPCIALAALTGLIVSGRLHDAGAAGRIARAMVTIERLDQLQVTAVDVEATSGSRASLSALGLSSQSAAKAAGQVASMTAPQARAHTDTDLAQLRADPDIGARLRPVTDAIMRARSELNAVSQSATPAAARAHIVAGAQDYSSTDRLIGGLQNAATEELVTGRFGTGSPALLSAAAQLQTMSDLELLGSLRPSNLYLTYVAPAAALPSLQAELRDNDAAYRLAAAKLPTLLSPALLAGWQRFHDGAGGVFDAIVTTSLARTLTATSPPPKVTDLLTIAPTLAPYVTGLSSLLDQAVAQGTKAAAVDRAKARHRARTTVLVMAAVLALTFGVLVLLGQTLSLRLADLAGSAQRLSSGRLESMTVHSPREIALISAGLNDAVVNLRQVATTAERLAAGDVSSPEVNHPTPGPLGAALHASVVLLADAIRQRQELEHQLGHQASHDSLTSLPNRAEAERLLADVLRASVDSGGPGRVAVLFVDLDHFKPVNDTYGHAAGDHVLQVSAARMQAQLREADTVARFGGDEFVVILHPAEASVVSAIGQRIVEALSAPIAFDGHQLRVGASVGVAVALSDEATGEDLLVRADLALYRAKAAGRNGIAY